MLEGLPPHNPTHLMRLETDEKTARKMADLIGEFFEPAETAVAAFEAPDEVTWLVEVYFAHAPDEAYVTDLVRLSAGDAVAGRITFDAIDGKDWVKASLDGLKPVDAGRFTIHGSHDRGRAAPQKIAIEIEAALAFGTGHHGTTLGCLKAIDLKAKRGRPQKVLDVGTGTGVLAIAAARAWKMKVFASDIDPVSVEAARANARFNKAGNHVDVVLAAGLDYGIFRKMGPFDLILANILPRPLVGMATPMAGLLTWGGTLVLSGIIQQHANFVINAYRARGLRLVKRGQIEGWVTLTFIKG